MGREGKSCHRNQKIKIGSAREQGFVVCVVKQYLSIRSVNHYILLCVADSKGGAFMVSVDGDDVYGISVL